MGKNAELVRQLKQVKQALVSRELHGEEFEEMQQAVAELEKVVSYINDCTGKGIEF